MSQDGPAPVEPAHAKAEPQHSASDNDREVNFVMDPSAFLLGLGNIKRWFQTEYFRTQLKNKAERLQLGVYLPTYTLNELNHQRRGQTMSSTKAREALSFIDHMLDEEGEPLNESLLYAVILDDANDRLISWEACFKYQIESVPAGLPANVTKVEHVNDFGEAYVVENDNNVRVPARLRYLIRSCIHMKGAKNAKQWKLVTEDATTKAWATNFGIDCLNINEAELLLFQGRDLTTLDIRPEGADFFADTDIYQQETDALHKRINTTAYKYHPWLEGKKESKPYTALYRDGVYVERFDMVTYAPRDDVLWRLVGSKMFKKPQKKV